MMFNGPILVQSLLLSTDVSFAFGIFAENTLVKIKVM